MSWFKRENGDFETDSGPEKRLRCDEEKRSHGGLFGKVCRVPPNASTKLKTSTSQPATSVPSASPISALTPAPRIEYLLRRRDYEIVDGGSLHRPAEVHRP